MAQRTTLNTDNLSAAQRPITTIEDQTIFVTKAEVVALVQQDKGRVSSATTCLSLRPPYPASIAAKPYPVGYTLLNFQKFDGQKGSTREHAARFIDAMKPFSDNAKSMPKRVLKISY